MKLVRYILIVLCVLSGAFCVSCGHKRPVPLSGKQIDSLHFSDASVVSGDEFKEAVVALRDAYLKAYNDGDARLQLDILTDLVPMMMRLGMRPEILDLLLDGLDMSRNIGDRKKESVFRHYLSLYYTEMGDEVHSDLYLREGIKLAGNVQDSDFSLRFAQGEVLAVLFNNGEFRKVIMLGRKMLESLDREDLSTNKGDAVYAQVCAMLACSYQVLINEQKASSAQMDSALYFENAYNSTAYSQRDGGQKLRNYYVAAGRNEQARVLLLSELDRLSMSDTVNVRYYRALKALASTYKNEGQYKDAFDFQSRAIRVKDSLDRQDMIQQGRVYATKIRAEKNKWAAANQKRSSGMLYALFTFAVIVIFLLMLFVIMNSRKARALETKNKMLAVSVASSARKDELISILSSTEATPADEELYYYRQIERLTEEKKLYLDKNLTRDRLLQEYGVPKSKIPQVLSRFAGVSTLNEYINAKRLNHAATLMVENKGMKLVDIARNSGFSNTTTLYRRFMMHYGMSPSEYIKRYHAVEENMSGEEPSIDGA